MPSLPAGTLALVFSNSGESAATVEAAARLRARRLPVIAFTSNPRSRLARLASATVVCRVPDTPKAGPHTTTHLAGLTKALLFIDALAAIHGGTPVGLRAAVEGLANAVRGSIGGDAPALEAVGASIVNAPRVFFVGAGPNYAAALTGAAKMLEAGYLPVMPQQLEEFAHEQMFLVEPEDPIFVVHSNGASLARAKEIAAGAADLGAQVFVVGPSAAGFERARHLPNHGDFGSHEEVSAVANIPPLQLVAYHAAMARGEDPDRMRNFDVNMRLIGQGRKTQALDERLV